MWWIIILIVVGYILFKFLSDRNKMIQNVAKDGGMKKKYSVLLNCLMSGSESEITHLTSDSIQLSIRSKYFIHHFSILQTFGQVAITWTAKGPTGEFKESWQFPSALDQYQMAEKIGNDMEFKMKNFGNYNALLDNINSHLNTDDPNDENPF